MLSARVPVPRQGGAAQEPLRVDGRGQDEGRVTTLTQNSPELLIEIRHP